MRPKGLEMLADPAFRWVPGMRVCWGGGELAEHIATVASVDKDGRPLALTGHPMPMELGGMAIWPDLRTKEEVMRQYNFAAEEKAK